MKMTNMSMTSWGNYPVINSQSLKFSTLTQLKDTISTHSDLIPRGNGRSYGDSALSKNVVQVNPHDLFLDFDVDNGLLHVQAGVLLADIIKVFVPRGWFLNVTPGTKLVTVGGAIASDVHGKNHHIVGCFSECVEFFNLMLPSGDTVKCSSVENTELFRATCGGMGLTGIILDAKISLKSIQSKYINQTTIKTLNLKDTFSAFEEHKNAPYSVAWIDCLASAKNLGRCLLTIGEFCTDGQLDYQPKTKINVPFNLPSFLLNQLSVKIFNWFYYRKVSKRVSQQKVGIDAFFFPLDAIGNWNRIYGKKGFTQYQIILPKETSEAGLTEILQTIADSGKGPFLAVLKLFGKANDNYLSFPIEGYSLALDFKIEDSLFKLLDVLDDIVLEYGGRVYLAKDVRVSQAVFEQSYPQLSTFKALRSRYKMQQKFNSLQSKRIGL